MSISDQITRIKNNIAAAYTACNGKGATMPLTENSANLADTVASIPSGGAPTLITKQIKANGTYSAEDETPPADGYKDVIVDVPSSIPVDGGSQTPLYFGVHASGFVLSSDPADETPVAFGVNANGHPYVKGGTA